MKEELAQFIKEHSLADRVVMTGAVSSERLREEIRRARALVLPSFAEGLPMVIMEAMALRRPVLTTFVAGIPELVRPGENGWLIPAGSVDALVTAMKDVLQCSPASLKVMGDAAHELAMDRHLVDKQAAQLAELFASPEIVN
jgi:glycosyltransferase involved in cell wall biosynthesis